MSGYHGWMAGTGAFDSIIDGAEELLRLARQQISYALSSRREARQENASGNDDAESRRQEERSEEVGAILVDGLLDERGADLVEWLYVNVPYIPDDDCTIYVSEYPYSLCSRCDSQAFDDAEPEPFELCWEHADLADDTQESLTREVVEDLLNDILPDVVYALPDRS